MIINFTGIRSSRHQGVSHPTKCKRLLHNHNKKVTKLERDLCYFENYLRKKTRAFNVARLLSTSVLIERIKILVASWLVAKLPGGEMTGNHFTYNGSVYGHNGTQSFEYITQISTAFWKCACAIDFSPSSSSFVLQNTTRRLIVKRITK